MTARSTPPVSIYLAGASRESERVKRWANAIDRSTSLTLVHRWFDSVHEWVGTDSELSRRQQINLASTEELAIRSAKIFWMLWPVEPRPGAFIELGQALAHRFHLSRSYDIVVSGPGAEVSIFTASVDCRDASDAIGFDAVLAAAHRHQFWAVP